MDKVIEYHIQNDMCCSCCEVAFTNKLEKGGGPIGRQCYNWKCPCKDSDKLCQTCRPECVNIDKRKTKPPKPTRAPTKPQDTEKIIDDVATLTSTPTPIPHSITKSPKVPWWKTSGCCPCSGFCKKGCPCCEGGVYCTNCRYLKKGTCANAPPSPPSAPKRPTRSSWTKRKTTNYSPSAPKHKNQKVADQSKDTDDEEDNPVNFILLILGNVTHIYVRIT